MENLQNKIIESGQANIPSISALMANRNNTCCYCKVYKNKCENCKNNINLWKELHPDYIINCRGCNIDKNIDSYLIIRSLPLMHRIRCIKCYKINNSLKL